MIISNIDNKDMEFVLPEYEYSNDEQYVLFGTGEVAESYYKQLVTRISSDRIAFFIDSMSDQKEIFGKKILKPFEVKNVNQYKYILCTFTSAVGMAEALIKLGVKEKNIIRSSKYTIDSFNEYEVKGRHICIYPPVDTQEKYRELENMFSAYLCQSLALRVDVETTIPEPKSNILRRVDQYDELSKYDLVLVWNKKNLTDEKIKGLHNAFCIDCRFFQCIDIKILTLLNYKLSDKNVIRTLEVRSKDNFKKLIGKNYKKGYLFGNGPSMTKGGEIVSKRKEDAYKIVCNAAVQNKNFMEMLCPDVYVLSDYYFIDTDNLGLLKEILDYVKNHDIMLCIPKTWIPLYVEAYGADENKLIGFSEDRTELSFPTKEQLSVYSKAHNVITRYGIPIASALCDEIYIAGCDGTKISKEEKLEWKHSQKDQKEEEENITVAKQEILNHYAFMEELLTYGESKGKKYFSFVESYIPALSSRRCRE